MIQDLCTPSDLRTLCGNEEFSKVLPLLHNQKVFYANRNAIVTILLVDEQKPEEGIVLVVSCAEHSQIKSSPSEAYHPCDVESLINVGGMEIEKFRTIHKYHQ